MTSIPPAIARANAATGADVPEHDTRLEPETPLPAKDEYRMGVLGWTGTAVGAAFGGALGLIGGGLFGLAAGSSFGPAAGTAAFIASTAVGLLGGGWVAHQAITNVGEERAEARHQAAIGSSVLAHAERMIAGYDHDGSRAIELDTAGLGDLDERTRTEERRQQRKQRDGEIERWTETRTISAARIWDRANGAPTDEVVTAHELALLMANYDVDGDGVLKTPEQDAFAAAHPEAVGDWRQ